MSLHTIQKLFSIQKECYLTIYRPNHQHASNINENVDLRAYIFITFGKNIPIEYSFDHASSKALVIFIKITQWFHKSCQSWTPSFQVTNDTQSIETDYIKQHWVLLNDVHKLLHNMHTLHDIGSTYRNTRF